MALQLGKGPLSWGALSKNFVMLLPVSSPPWEQKDMTV